MATPLLRALKSAFPKSYIAWFVEKEYADILADNPLIDEVIAYDAAAWRRQFRYGDLVGYLRESLALRRSLKAKRFDVAINLTAEKWWSVWLNAAPLRIGLFPRPRVGLMGRLYTTAIEQTHIPVRLHNTEHYLLPAKALGIPEPYSKQMVMGVSDRHRSDVDAMLREQSEYVHGRPIVVLHPGTSQQSKCWLPEQYAALARRMAGYNVVITGSGRERGLAEEIARLSGQGLIIAAGRLSHIGQSAALIERAVAVVTGDTSVLHIASALDVPLVGIYGSTRPRANAPLFGRPELLFDDHVPCAPCYKAKCPLPADEFMRCMRAVPVDEVIAALERLGVTIGNDAPAQV